MLKGMWTIYLHLSARIVGFNHIDSQYLLLNQQRADYLFKNSNNFSFFKGWIRMSLKLHNKTPRHRPSSPPEACALVPMWPSVRTRLSRRPSRTAPSRVLRCPSRRFVLSPTRPRCTETRSPIFRTPTRGPSASSGKRTVNTWLLMDSQTRWRDSSPRQRRVPARKWLSSRVPWQHSIHKWFMKEVSASGLNSLVQVEGLDPVIWGKATRPASTPPWCKTCSSSPFIQNARGTRDLLQTFLRYNRLCD